MSDTPRTDSHNWHDGDYDDPLHAFADFAKQLERELNAANERIKRLEKALTEIELAMKQPAANHMMQIAGPARQVINIIKKAKEAKL